MVHYIYHTTHTSLGSTCIYLSQGWNSYRVHNSREEARAAVYTHALLLISRGDYRTLYSWEYDVEKNGQTHHDYCLCFNQTHKKTFLFINEYLHTHTSVQQELHTEAHINCLFAIIHYILRHSLPTCTINCIHSIPDLTCTHSSMPDPYIKSKIKGCSATHSVSACVVKQLLITFCKLDYVQTLT